MWSMIFFALACLGPMAVTCDNRRWTPNSVPWPAQQCIDRDPRAVGECTIPVEKGVKYRRIPLCQALSCAVPRSDGTYELARGLGRPIDGTLCGILQACRHGKCVNIDIDHIPTMTGARNSFTCKPQEAYLPQGNVTPRAYAVKATNYPKGYRAD